MDRRIENLEINRYQQVANLIKNIESVQWQNTKIVGSKNYEDWIPIISLFEDEEILTGISKSGYWVLKYDDCIIFLSDDRYLRDILPFLKVPFNELHLLIDEELRKKKIPIAVKDTFPIKGLILTGLKSQSKFWAELALNWLEHITIDDQIQEQLQKITETRWASQKTRQKASKFLKGKIKQKV